MRLLNTTTLELEFFPARKPNYAILSHRWEDEEVTFEDLQAGGSPRQLKGYSKLENGARMARREGYEFIWIDTCCINKSSSAELSEAINSMFHWYQASDYCFVYLSDVVGNGIRDSQWFRRGWTLQELLAPRHVHFYDKFWEPLGTKHILKDEIHSITGIGADVLLGAELSTIPACTKMSWAAARATTRPEDMAYCLIGLFGVNMPLLYGEGAEKAFRRLQETFVRESDDESIFAWMADAIDVMEKPCWSLLAISPAYFKDSGRYCIPLFKTWRHPTEVTSKGLRLSLLLEPLKGDLSRTLFLAPLNCSRSEAEDGQTTNAFSIILQRMSDVEDLFTRVRPDKLIELQDDNEISLDNPSRPLSLYVSATSAGASPVAGFSVSPEQKLSFEFPTNTRLGPRVYEGTARIRLSGNAPWRSQGAESQQRYFAHLRKGAPDLDPMLFDLNELRARRVVGCLELKVSSIVVNKDAFLDSTEPRSFSMKQDTVYLFVGFEPLPSNSLETPRAFIRPWYSFSASNDQQAANQLVSSDSNLNQAHSAPGGYKLRAHFDPATYQFRTCYDIVLTGAGRANAA